jgi:hypothetical protein
MVYTALHNAAGSGRSEKLQKLLDSSYYNVNARDADEVFLIEREYVIDRGFERREREREREREVF